MIMCQLIKQSYKCPSKLNIPKPAFCITYIFFFCSFSYSCVCIIAERNNNYAIMRVNRDNMVNK